MSYIDFHTHIGPLWYGREPLSPAEMIAWMDEHEVAQAVFLALESPEGASYYITSKTVLEICAQYPDRLIPFAVIDPRMAMPAESAYRSLLLEYFERGARGVGEVKVGLPIDDPQLQRIYAVCDEFEQCCLLHLDGQRCVDDTRLSGLERMLQTYPRCRFIGHAPGFWNAISGDFRDEDKTGYPRGPVTPGGAVERLLRDYPNLYGDLSAGSGHNAIMRDVEHGRGFLTRCADKVLFATDYLMKNQDVPQFDMMAALQLPPAVHEAIAAGNARRLLGL
ncbi:MAG: amidohydrolase family protein [Fimbriimonadaceae bacterium]|nr:amidohydrolase family protein [Fimbriimonadaceae bacterium]